MVDDFPAEPTLSHPNKAGTILKVILLSYISHTLHFTSQLHPSCDNVKFL